LGGLSVTAFVLSMENPMIRRFVSTRIWALSTGATVLALGGAPANAAVSYWKEMAPTACQVVAGVAKVNPLQENGNLVASQASTILCPYVDDSDHPYPDANGVNVYTQTRPGATAQACVTPVDPGTPGEFCGAAALGQGNNGRVTWQILKPNLSRWHDPNLVGFGYVKVVLPATTVDPFSGQVQASRLSGLWVTFP
jgi:hypothetical protein